MAGRTASGGEASQPPVRLAAVDVGATSVRMEIAELEPGGAFHTCERLVHPVSLGNDTFRIGEVRPQTLRAICRVMANFSRILSEYRVSDCRAVATSAIREAANKDILIDHIRHESGLQINVLDAVDEMRFTYQLLQPFLKKRLGTKKGYTLILDLGGGSTEMMLLKGQHPVFVSTRRLGTARLFQQISAVEGGDARAL
ncbi:MAG: exopolyphosphatase, partial [Planctomycetota bacterium]